MKITLTQQFQQFFATNGVSLSSLFEQAGIPNLLWQEQVELSPIQYWHLLQAFDHALSDDMIIRISRIDALKTFMPAFFAALSAHDGRAAIKRLADYKQLIGPIVFAVTETAETLNVQIRFSQDLAALPRFALLNEQLLLTDLIRTGTGNHTLRPMQLQAPLTYTSAINATFGVTGQTTKDNMITFTRRDLQRTFITENNIMWEYLAPGMQQQLKAIQHEQTFNTTVQASLFKHLTAGDATIDTIAAEMGLSARSLQRRLAEQHTTFNQQLRQVQQESAQQYLRDGNLSTSEIAYLIGYADPNSFSRAFKNWTGQTLSQYRQTLR